MTDASKYDQRGVSADKSDVHKAIKNLDKGLFDLAFCKILPDIVGQDETYCNIMHADTAGTKPSLAYLYWKETGDMSVWQGIVQDALVMNLDDMACVGCVDDIIISSTIGRNKHLIPGEVITALIEGCTAFIEEMQSHGISIHLSGGETADVGDIVRTLDVGYTAFARLKRRDLIVNNIKGGDVIVGLASYGQSTYEDRYNGGMGSNGLTSARHDVFTKAYADKYPETYDGRTNRDLVYSGSRKVTDTIDIDGQNITVGQLVLSPTRTYLPVLKQIIDQFRPQINGIIHCTGGAQTKVKKFIKQKQVIKDSLFELPPLFQLIQSESRTEWREMYQVFNMGHRMELYVPEQIAEDIISISKGFNIDAKVIGRVEDADQSSVEIHSSYGQFTY